MTPFDIHCQKVVLITEKTGHRGLAITSPCSLAFPYHLPVARIHLQNQGGRIFDQRIE
jgi:hypothetical protein